MQLHTKFTKYQEKHINCQGINVMDQVVVNSVDGCLMDVMGRSCF